MTDDQLAAAIRKHLCYELKWLIFAALEFEKVFGRNSSEVAFQDSALLHLRNLHEFATAGPKSDELRLG